MWGGPSFHPLGTEEAVRPQGNVRLSFVVEAGAVPEPLRGVQAEGEDEPLGHPGPDGVVGYLEVGLIERCRSNSPSRGASYSRTGSTTATCLRSLSSSATTSGGSAARSLGTAEGLWAEKGRIGVAQQRLVGDDQCQRFVHRQRRREPTPAPRERVPAARPRRRTQRPAHPREGVQVPEHRAPADPELLGQLLGRETRLGLYPYEQFQEPGGARHVFLRAAIDR